MLPNNIQPNFPIALKNITHYDKGRENMIPDLIVIHIAEGNKNQVFSTFINEQKSSHLLVNKDGSIWQFVNTKDTAWGNGIVNNPISSIVLSRPNINPNLYTISIENEGYSFDDITDAQYNSNVALVSFLCKKWNIPMDSTHIIRHREIESTKSCPGMINIEKIIQKVRLLG